MAKRFAFLKRLEKGFNSLLKDGYEVAVYEESKYGFIENVIYVKVFDEKQEALGYCNTNYYQIMNKGDTLNV